MAYELSKSRDTGSTDLKIDNFYFLKFIAISECTNIHFITYPSAREK